MAQAIAIIPNGTLGQAYQSAPTGGLGNYVAQSGWICAMSALFQQPHIASVRNIEAVSKELKNAGRKDNTVESVIILGELKPL